MAKKTTKTVKFPKTVYVKREMAGEDSYLLVNEDGYDYEDNSMVAIYELVAVKKLTVTRELV